MLLDPTWLEYDDHTKAIRAGTWYTNNSDAVDNTIRVECELSGISVAEIPVDEVTGYITNVFLRELGVNYALYLACSTKWGIRDTDSDDIYRAKTYFYEQRYREYSEGLTRGVVLG